MTYDIYRNTTLIATVNPTGTQTKQIMGANTVAMSFTLPTQTEFKVGDYVDVYGERYYINFPPSEKEQSSIRWEYSLELQAIPYDLMRAKYFGYNANNVLNVPDHDLTGDANAFLQLLLANLNRIQSGWTIGDVDATKVLTLQFSANDNCLAVLSRLAEQFRTEYWIEGKTIHLTKRGEILPTVLEWGVGKGLRGIERVPLDQNPPITRLYVYGSSKNLPASYRGYSNRLQLPVSVTNGYLEANVAEYGIREGIYINEEIYPNREGVVTGVVGSVNQFSDSGIDFDINAQLMPGISAKVKFISGALSGYQFEVASYNHATKTIRFNNNTDEKAFTVPSETQKPAIGDKWVIFDIILPQSYIDEAEGKLLTDGQLYHSQNSGSRYNYNLTTDPFHFQRQSLYLQLGKYITLKSPEWGINGAIRIVGFTRDIQHPYQYPSVEVSEVTQINPAVIADSKQRELVRDVGNTKKITERVGSLAYQSLVEKAMLGETLIVGGYLRAELIETITLIVQNLMTGKVRITEADNNIRIVDDLDRNIVVIDDDVANEGDNIYGSGMRIGRISETPASTTSAKGFYLYGADGTELSFIRGDANVNSVGMFTKSGLQVDGLSNLNNITYNGYISPRLGLRGIDLEKDVRVGGTDFYKMTWVKGVLVSAVLQ